MMHLSPIVSVSSTQDEPFVVVFVWQLLLEHYNTFGVSIKSADRLEETFQSAHHFAQSSLASCSS